MQIRTINEAIKILKEEDPNTELSYASVRNMIQSEVLPAMKSGNKYLIDVDVLRSMFGAATPTQEKEVVHNFTEETWNYAVSKAKKNMEANIQASAWSMTERLAGLTAVMDFVRILNNEILEVLQ